MAVTSNISYKMHKKSSISTFNLWVSRFAPKLFSLSLLCISYSSFAETPEEKATAVFAKTITTSAITPKIEALGTLKASESVTLSASVTDTLSAIHFDDESQVNQGELLVELSHAEERALLVESESAVAEAKRQFERLNTLISSDSTSQSLLDEKRLAYDSAKAKLAAAQARLNDHLIRAPFSGRVGLRQISLGALVKPGDTITTLDKVDQMKLDMRLPATTLKQIYPGMTLSASALANSSHSYEGTVRSIDSRVDPITRSIVVRATITNSDLMLKPGMQMRAILESPALEVLLVPEEALIRNGKDEFVFLAKPIDGKLRAQKTPVTSDRRYQGQVVINSGLIEGEKVIIHGISKIKHGALITISAEETDNESLSDLLKTSTTHASPNATP